ncbi:hypothetical protein PtA15_4A404 [Puccinia triticina]|uniref:Uncharacterized protein n=1 Tax=Puccinia triticina TaxID=208348 RepID=A0ABY7CHY1_9BASI|nr:uncharacterized protein PtA15_4A404 [Puccinia triticina]WAQ83953.1 hypothetical protein PtA15_4A404 [Puccinia triticina]
MKLFDHATSIVASAHIAITILMLSVHVALPAVYGGSDKPPIPCSQVGWGSPDTDGISNTRFSASSDFLAQKHRSRTVARFPFSAHLFRCSGYKTSHPLADHASLRRIFAHC